MFLFFFFHFIELGSHLSALIWAVMLSSAAIVITLPRESGIRTLVASTILRLIFSIGPEPTLWLLGFVTVRCIIVLNFNYDINLNSFLFVFLFLNIFHSFFPDRFKDYPSNKYYRKSGDPN